MTTTFGTTTSRGEATGIAAGLALQSEGLRLLWAEMRALQALIPAGHRALPDDAETESAFDNMPV